MSSFNYIKKTFILVSKLNSMFKNCVSIDREQTSAHTTTLLRQKNKLQLDFYSD